MIRQTPNNDQKFYHPLIVDGVDIAIRASLAVFSNGYLCLVGLFIYFE